MGKIYVPDINYQCYVLQNANVIRAYESTNWNSYNRYHDYYTNQNYLEQIGESYNYQTNYSCIDRNLLTNEVYYRLDFDKILIIFLILVIVCFWFPFNLFMKLFKKRL